VVAVVVVAESMTGDVVVDVTSLSPSPTSPDASLPLTPVYASKQRIR